MYKITLVGLGGFIGASSRYLITTLASRLISSNFPYGTFLVNIIGCFLIGVIMELYYKFGVMSDNFRLFVLTGILGGLTTFSTFSNDTIELLSRGKTYIAILNVSANVILCLLGVWIGKLIIQGLKF